MDFYVYQIDEKRMADIEYLLYIVLRVIFVLIFLIFINFLILGRRY